jgi:glucose/mannose-6-phosphate isomerase
LQAHLTLMMYDLIANFPNHLNQAVADFDKSVIHHDTKDISNIVVCGLGGSGFIGDLIKDICSQDLNVPLIIVKGYRLPTFVDNNTLIIIASYSGNTEEALSCFSQAIKKSNKPICISAGGMLKSVAIENSCIYVEMPFGLPPRTSLGFGFTNMLYLLISLNLISEEKANLPLSIASFLLSKQNDIKESAEQTAKIFKSSIIVSYVEDAIEAVAIRLKQQINENSKAYCWYNVLPELNHNELVGWKQAHHNIKGLFLRTSFEHPRNKHRFDFIKPVVESYDTEVVEIHAVGETFAEQYFYLIHWCDWLSYYLALEHEVDPIEVNVIDKLKNYLANII